MAERIAEIIEKRTASAKSYLRDDGRIETDIFLDPVHYPAADGTWQDSALAWDISERLSWGIKVKKALFNLRLFAEGGLYKLRFGFALGSYVDYTLPLTRLADASISGRVGTITDAWPSTDAKYTVTPKGVKSDIVLKAPGHPTSFAFPLALTGCMAGIIGNRLIFSRDNKVVGRIPAPFAVDAGGQRGPVALSYDGTAITFTPDAVWLATAVYPVTIDPTTTIQPSGATGKDTYLTEWNPTNNYATDTSLIAGRSTDGVNWKNFRSLIEFDISAITTPITSAILVLYCTGELSTTNYNASIHKVLASWVEASATWIVQPAYDAASIATTSITGTGAAFNFDITALVEAWRTGSITNYGIMVKGEESADVGSQKTFASSDHATASYRPKLTVLHGETAPTVSAPASTTSGSPTSFTNEITPQTAWSTGYTQASYQVRFLDGTDVAYDTGEVAGAGTTYSPPTTALKYGVTYGVQVRAKGTDGAWSDWSTTHYLTCAMTAPASLTATADAANAEIDLAWTAHVGENLAGYRVYRKLSTASTYVLHSVGLVLTNAYSDHLTASGVTYDYKVTAVATDGYESPQSSSAQRSVTFTGFWIDNTAVELRDAVSFEYPRRVSRRVGTDGDYILQDLGALPRIAQFVMAFTTLAGRDAILAMFPTGTVFSYRDQEGVTFRGQVTGTVGEDRLRTPGRFYGTLRFEASEVLP